MFKSRRQAQDAPNRGYKLVRQLGEGVYGLVYETACGHALKMQKMDDKGNGLSQAILTEADVLRRCMHPHLVHCHDIFVTTQNLKHPTNHEFNGRHRYLNLLLDKADSGDLDSCLRRFRPPESKKNTAAAGAGADAPGRTGNKRAKEKKKTLCARLLDNNIHADAANDILLLSRHEKRVVMVGSEEDVQVDDAESAAMRVEWLRQLASALWFLHRHSIAHCDLKPDNVLLHQRRVKLTDFGLAQYLVSAKQSRHMPIQAQWYRAPEVLRGDDSYDYAVDMWSFGLVACQAVFALYSVPEPLRLQSNETDYFAAIQKGMQDAGGSFVRAFLTADQLNDAAAVHGGERRLSRLTALIDGCLRLDRRQRLTSLEALRKLNHLVQAPHDDLENIGLFTQTCVPSSLPCNLLQQAPELMEWLFRQQRRWGWSDHTMLLGVHLWHHSVGVGAPRRPLGGIEEQKDDNNGEQKRRTGAAEKSKTRNKAKMENKAPSSSSSSSSSTSASTSSSTSVSPEIQAGRIRLVRLLVCVMLAVKISHPHDDYSADEDMLTMLPRAWFRYKGEMELLKSDLCSHNYLARLESGVCLRFGFITFAFPSCYQNAWAAEVNCPPQSRLLI